MRSRRILSHIRSNVVGYVALFIALGGTAWALERNSVKSKHIAPNAAKGADVKESSLSTVPKALIARHGGWGRQSDGPEDGENCNPESSAFMPCEIVNVTTTAPGRALVIGRIQAVVESGVEAVGACRLGSLAVNPIPGTSMTVFVDSTVFGEWTTVVGITPPLDPGTHAFGIDCNELLGGMSYKGARVNAVMLSPD